MPLHPLHPVQNQSHPFDHAIDLQSQGGDIFLGHTSAAYWNMVGPFGGILAAIALKAVMQHSARLGVPVSLTVNYAAAMVQGPFEVQARAARTNRSTQHWIIEIRQDSDGNAAQTVLTATALTAVRRKTWGVSEIPMPDVPAPQELHGHSGMLPLEWINRYDLRFVSGKIPQLASGSVPPLLPIDEPSLTQLWMRDQPPRPLDFCSLVAFADVFYPRIFLRRPRRVPVGTVSMTVYFHADSSELQNCGTGFLLGQARGQVFHDGFLDQSAQLWSEAGTLLVTSLQIMYYKE